MLLSADTDIQRAVHAAGWTFVRFGGRGVIVEGREYDVIRFGASNGGLAAWVTVLRGESASDPFVVRTEMDPRIVSAVRGAASLKVGVDVRDNGAAIELMKKLMAHPRPAGFLGYVTAISELGWTVDRDRMWENDYDFTWTIPAQRGEDQLRFGALFSGGQGKDEPVHVGDFGGARMVKDGASWSLDVRVAAPAREFADALVRGA
jgi:hypothetical protein